MGLTFRQPTPITFPNSEYLPKGSEVNIWSLDHELGVFFIAGRGRVSDDEKRIETLPGGGLREASRHFILPLLPYWGSNRTFTLKSNNECPAPPLEYSEKPDSTFYNEAKEVYEVGKQLTKEQKQIALFWADNPGQSSTPAGHWVSILNQALAERNSDLAFAAEAYAKLGVAVADAFITCWHTKYIYNVLRPITYIQNVIDPAWNVPNVTDPIVTPSFPEYTSGHSVQSGAAAQVLTSLFGDNFAFTDYTHLARGYSPHSFPSFSAAAEEAAISRLDGGIHFRSAIENGLTQGHCIAERVLSLRFRH